MNHVQMILKQTLLKFTMTRNARDNPWQMNMATISQRDQAQTIRGSPMSDEVFEKFQRGNQ